MRSLCVFSLADNLCLRAEQMAGNLAITVCRNRTALTRKPQPRLLFCPFSLVLSPLPHSLLPHLTESHRSRGEAILPSVPFLLTPSWIGRRISASGNEESWLLPGSYCSLLTLVFLAAISDHTILIVRLSPNRPPSPCFFRFFKYFFPGI